jgi:pSer/pThr/pTyr-binding forkhead associated (FHA) protein
MTQWWDERKGRLSIVEPLASWQRIGPYIPMPAAERATGKDIILDIVENMRAYQEELLYSSVVPTAFEVHLHPDDYDRLEGIFPVIAAETRRALDEELARQNRRLGPEWLHRLTRPAGPAQPAHDAWTVAFFRDENEELQPGEVLVDSRLTLPPAPELGAGTRTRRITTSRLGTQTSTRSRVIDEPPPVAHASTAQPLTASPDTSPAGGTPVVFATLTFEDKSGPRTHAMTESQLVIGRGGAGYWVDLRVDAAPDVSREHVRLRRDVATGQFFLKDLSLYGTTVNGERVASSIDTSDGAKRDVNLEVPLPPVARIGLADMVFLDFRVAGADDDAVLAAIRFPLSASGGDAVDGLARHRGRAPDASSALMAGCFLP